MSRVPLALVACMATAWIGCSALGPSVPVNDDAAESTAAESTAVTPESESLLVNLSVPNMT